MTPATIKCVAIDDEPIALSIIAEYCRRRGNLELRIFTSPIAGMECIEAEHPQIVFLDIEMNSHNGVELARCLPAGTCLIFTTAYSDYALDGFNADAVDFLHKPIFYPRFERALEKAEKWLRAYDYVETTPMPGAPEPSVAPTLTLKVEHKNVVLQLSDITYIEAMDNYVKVYRRNYPMVLSQTTMKDMESRLPAHAFIRVHRSFIVARAAIGSYSNRLIHIDGARRDIPVGRKYMESFRNIYLSNKTK